MTDFIKRILLKKRKVKREMKLEVVKQHDSD